MEKKKILVIEDEDFIRKTLTVFLEGENYNVTTVSSATAAIRKLEHQYYDLVITDLMLPYSGGLDIVDHIKDNFLLSSTPVIILTGMDKDILSSTVTRAEACVTKPFSPPDLIKLVKEMLN
jgi:two-component system, OmpR family, response regulator ResD